jgi:transcriptional regulator with XRE-family HTH domain
MVQVDTIQAGETVVKTVKERSNMVKARESVHLTQEEVATGIRVDVRTVRSWENATRTPYLRHVKKLRGILEYIGTDIDLLKVFEVPVDKPNTVEESQDALEPMEEPKDTQEPTKDSTTLDELKRRSLEKIVQAAGIGFIPGTALLSAPIIGPDGYLEQARFAIDDCWLHLKHGDFYRVGRSLNAHVPILTQYANTESEHQSEAAEIAVQAKILQMILATHRLDYATRRKLGGDAVRFGRISDNPLSLATALFWQGGTFIYCYRQPEKAIVLFDKALAKLGSDAMLNRSSIYSDLAIAHAQIQDETHTKENEQLTLDYIKLARDTMPTFPELDPFHQCIMRGPAELDKLEGKAYLYLAEHFLTQDYAQQASDAFNKSISKPATNQALLGQTLIHKADAAMALNEMQEYETCLRKGLDIATKINSHKRMSEIRDVVSRLPESWQRESKIITLQEDISSVKLIIPS